MDPKSTSERLVETMAHIFLRPEKQPPAASAGEARPFSIAVSRDSGANGHLIARAVGARLDWPVYDKELLSRIADEMGLRARLLEGLDEKQVNWLQDALAGFASAAAVDSGAYVHRLVETLLSLAAHGECVILGRGAAQVLPANTTLRAAPHRPAEGQGGDGPAAAGRHAGGGQAPDSANRPRQDSVRRGPLPQGSGGPLRL